jgi:hypothetical protein
MGLFVSILGLLMICLIFSVVGTLDTNLAGAFETGKAFRNQGLHNHSVWGLTSAKIVA